MPNIYTPATLLAGFGFDGREIPGSPVHQAGEQWAPEGFNVSWHKHAVWELYYQIEGRSVWRDRQRTYALEAGDAFAMPPHRPHVFDNPHHEAHHFYYAGIDVSGALDRHPDWRTPLPDRPWRTTPGNTGFAAAFRDLIREISLPEPHDDGGLLLSVDKLTLEWLRLLKPDSPTPRQPLHLHPAVARCRELIETHPGEGWTLPALAKVAGLSPDHLARRFKAEIGVTPSAYLSRCRIARACDQLRQTNRSITDIAADLGFASSQHFATAFRQHTGRAPRQWRKESDTRITAALRSLRLRD
ncbi:MAG: helix-turn-helix domain-containing protein [Opitutales bacterium]